MLGRPLLYIILIALFSIGVAYFQYFYKAKRKSVKTNLFAFLRFLSLFLLGLLLLNPKFKQTELKNIKPKLIVAADVSESVSFLKQEQQVANIIQKIRNSSILSDKFDIDYYRFGNTTELIQDSLLFRSKQTNIAQVYPEFKDLYNDNISPTIIITDGNQTYGQDYVVASKTYKQPIYPVLIGDTIIKTDLKIQKLQHNKYAFLENDFPLEVTLSYQGDLSVNQAIKIKKGERVIYKKMLSFSKENNTELVSLTLPATHIGRHKYTVTIDNLDSEENIKNNVREFSLQVIDERTNVLFVSSILHPDIGMYKKAIETNKQRKVTIVKPSTTLNLNDFQLVVLYQPDTSFKGLLDKIKGFNKNYWLIGGLQTNWSVVNAIQNNYQFKSTNKTQDYQVNFNDNFALFQQENLSFELFPPLHATYGSLELKNEVSTLLYQNINGISTDNPSFSFFENGKQRTAFLFGEGIWKWRAQSFINENSFESFDAFIGKTIQFLASNTRKERLVVNADETYNLGTVFLEAQYFDKNYVLDTNAKVSANIKSIETGELYAFDFLFKGNGYVLDVSNLPSGNYEYRIEVEKDGLVKNGNFEVLDFNIEEQFLNPDVTKLQQIATNSNNRLYHVNNPEQLFADLAQNENFKTIQKAYYKESPLIHWKYLLVILLLVLSLEWFLRKYNGLI